MKRLQLLWLLLLWCVCGLQAQTAPKVYYFSINDNISKPALRKTEKAVEEATKLHANVLFLELNTFGGELEVADKIRTLLLNAPMPTIVFINNNAASAGALISIACDSIYMAAGSSFGAASVVDQEGKVLPDKYQSYMRSLMRATAEKNGRNPDIAQAMVDPDVEIKNISDKGKVLTFTTEEAMAHGYCEGVADNKKAVLRAAQLENCEVVNQELSVLDKIINFLINPVVSSILIMCIVGGIYFEFQAPGLGLPIIIAIAAALLFFAPHFLEGLAAHWEILLFLAGVLLIILEIFVIPGFGVLGISGIILVVASLVLTMVFNIGFHFNFDPTIDSAVIMGRNILLVVFSFVSGFFLALWAGKKIITTETRFGTMALKTQLDTEHGYSAPNMNMQKYVGCHGITITFMRPAGKIEIDGEYLEATSELGLIDKNEEVVVTKFENAQLYVKKTNH